MVKTLIWRGDAKGVAQVSKAVLANVQFGDSFTLAINRKELSYTLDDDTMSTYTESQLTQAALQGLSDAVSASTDDEWEKVTPSLLDLDEDGYYDALYLTGQDNGEPFTVTGGSSNAGGFAVSVTTLTAGVADTNEIQNVALDGATSGTFTLTFQGQTTGAVAYNASAGTLQTALEALSNIASGDVTVTGDAGGPWAVEFKQAYAGVNVALMTGDGSSLDGGQSVEVVETSSGGGGNEIWTLTWLETGSTPNQADALALRLTRDGSTIVENAIYLLRDATEAATQAAVDAGIGSGQVQVTYDTTDTNIWYFEWVGDAAALNIAITPIELLAAYQIVSGSLSPITPTSDYAEVAVDTNGGTSTNETQVITLRGGPTGGTFTLTFNGSTTSTIAYNGSAATVQSELFGLASISGVSGNVSVSGNNGGPWSVTFTGAFAGTDVPLITGSASSLTGGSVFVTTTQQAAVGTNEIQRVTLTGNPTGGTFTLTFNAETTGAIDYDATAAEVQAALVALATPVAGDFSVTGVDGGPWNVQFKGAYAATNVSALTGNAGSLTGVGTQTNTISSVTSPTGPNWWSEPDNWQDVASSTAAYPSTGDTVIFDDCNVDCLYGIDQSGVTVVMLDIRSGYTGSIGLEQRDNNGDVFWEYRTGELNIGASVVRIGDGSGSGSPRIRLNTGSVQTAIEVLNTGIGNFGDLPAFRWRGTHASNSMRAHRGEVGVALEGGHTATLASLYIGYIDSKESDASVAVGESVTLGAIVKTGGTLRSRSGATSLDNRAGDAEFIGSGDLATLYASAGTVAWSSSGSLGKMVMISGITQADPAVVTAASHGLTTGDRVRITDVTGMTEVNGNTYSIEVLTSDSFSLVGVDSSAFTAYIGGGYANLIGSVKISGGTTLTFERSTVAKTVGPPIVVLGSEATVLDEQQTVSGLLLDVIDGGDPGSRFAIGGRYRLSRETADWP